MNFSTGRKRRKDSLGITGGLNLKTGRREARLSIDGKHALVVGNGNLVQVFVASVTGAFTADHAADIDDSAGNRFTLGIDDASPNLLFRFQVCFCRLDPLWRQIWVPCLWPQPGFEREVRDRGIRF